MRTLPQPEQIIPTLLFMLFVAIVGLFIEAFARHTGRWK